LVFFLLLIMVSRALATVVLFSLAGNAPRGAFLCICALVYELIILSVAFPFAFLDFFPLKIRSPAVDLVSIIIPPLLRAALLFV
jgi:hypothetical protein